ncbi:hypothetical protein ACIA5G_27230 [Amycolatopsis sp. NPDC051758]|uniref:effector-associated constant component EACC1 n=1 Tax=Amycolatopsis sp. NPDC051758 TaxID=3363935 RepID=UPI00379FDDA9
MVVTGGRADLDDAFADLQQRDVERAATEVEDQDGLFLVELASLDDWLSHSDELRGRVKVTTPPPGPEHMGSALDLLTVAVGAGGMLTVLANSLKTWLSQPRRSTVTVQVVKPDGVRVKITGENLRSADELADLLRTSLHGDQDD